MKEFKKEVLKLPKIKELPGWRMDSQSPRLLLQPLVQLPFTVKSKREVNLSPRYPKEVKLPRINSPLIIRKEEPDERYLLESSLYDIKLPNIHSNMIYSTLSRRSYSSGSVTENNDSNHNLQIPSVAFSKTTSSFNTPQRKSEAYSSRSSRNYLNDDDHNNQYIYSDSKTAHSKKNSVFERNRNNEEAKIEKIFDINQLTTSVPKDIQITEKITSFDSTVSKNLPSPLLPSPISEQSHQQLFESLNPSKVLAIKGQNHQAKRNSCSYDSEVSLNQAERIEIPQSSKKHKKEQAWDNHMQDVSHKKSSHNNTFYLIRTENIDDSLGETFRMTDDECSEVQLGRVNYEVLRPFTKVYDTSRISDGLVFEKKNLMKKSSFQTTLFKNNQTCFDDMDLIHSKGDSKYSIVTGFNEESKELGEDEKRRPGSVTCFVYRSELASEDLDDNYHRGKYFINIPKIDDKNQAKQNSNVSSVDGYGKNYSGSDRFEKDSQKDERNLQDGLKMPGEEITGIANENKYQSENFGSDSKGKQNVEEIDKHKENAEINLNHELKIQQKDLKSNDNGKTLKKVKASKSPSKMAKEKLADKKKLEKKNTIKKKILPGKKGKLGNLGKNGKKNQKVGKASTEDRKEGKEKTTIENVRSSFVSEEEDLKEDRDQISQEGSKNDEGLNPTEESQSSNALDNISIINSRPSLKKNISKQVKTFSKISISQKTNQIKSLPKFSLTRNSLNSSLHSILNEIHQNPIKTFIQNFSISLLETIKYLSLSLKRAKIKSKKPKKLKIPSKTKRKGKNYIPNPKKPELEKSQTDSPLILGQDNLTISAKSKLYTSATVSPMSKSPNLLRLEKFPKNNQSTSNLLFNVPSIYSKYVSLNPNYVKRPEISLPNSEPSYIIKKRQDSASESNSSDSCSDSLEQDSYSEDSLDEESSSESWNIEDRLRNSALYEIENFELVKNMARSIFESGKSISIKPSETFNRNISELGDNLYSVVEIDESKSKEIENLAQDISKEEFNAFNFKTSDQLIFFKDETNHLILSYKEKGKVDKIDEDSTFEVQVNLKNKEKFIKTLEEKPKFTIAEYAFLQIIPTEEFITEKLNLTENPRFSVIDNLKKGIIKK